MPEPPIKRRVLIASSHALFGRGLLNLLQARRQEGVEVVGMVSNLDQALEALSRLHPDLIIVDYDDQELNREEFLMRFVEGESKLRLVLLSLQSPQAALVYDRRSMAASQIDNWLDEWTISEDSPESSPLDQAVVPQKLFRRSVMNRLSQFIRNGRHLIAAAIMVVIVTAGFLFVLEKWGYKLLPIPAARQAESIDSLFDLQFKVIAFLFSLIIVLMLYSFVFFRRKRGDTTDAAHIEGNTRLEVAWTIAPLATVLFFAYLGGASLAETLRADPYPLQIDVIGQQWSWSFEYTVESAGVEKVISDKLYLPVNKQALLNLSSLDVIHSFWVPEFRVKQDALPGGEDFVRTLRITPVRNGTYKVRCAELCGLRHAFMENDVVVVTEEEFTAWLDGEIARLSDPVAIGESLYNANCKACHSLDGSKIVGPSWKGIFGRTEKLTDGSEITVDEEYLRESILNPNLKIVDTYSPGIMPQNYAELLSDEEINALVEYIKTIK